ncbi:MAG: FHA domain-containing protein [Deltaproteobacteria bacterium]|nr:FHA domain-containing protein [Deltaproteobacteria bacterium]
MVTVKTTTDVGATQWAIDDAVVRLRIWGADEILELEGHQEVVIGTDAMCTMRITDSSGRASRRHATATREGHSWTIRDLGSKNGLRIDGAQIEATKLVPGMEIGLGGITIVVESTRSIELRSYLMRLLGWSGERTAAVDLAMRAIRMAAMRRAPLVISGPDHLVDIAHGIHERALGSSKPFVQCDPRRNRAEGTVRSAMNFDLGAQALRAAQGGTLCVWSHRLPADFLAVRTAIDDPQHRVMLVMCTHGVIESQRFAAVPVVIPPFSHRKNEVGRIVSEYGADAVASLKSDAPFTSYDRDWVLEQSAASLKDIEKGTLRLVALRKHGTVVRAAQALRMSHVALYQWLSRRRPPPRSRS